MSAIVIRKHNGEEVNRIDVTGKSESAIEKVEMGLARNFNFDDYMFGLED